MEVRAVVRFAKIWPAIASGLLLIAAFPPFRLSLLVFVGLVPWLTYLRTCDGKRAFRSGILFGFVYWLGEMSFVFQFVTKWTSSIWLGLIPYIAACLFLSLYGGIFGWIARICYVRSIPWAIPIVWAGIEAFRSYATGVAFPYGLIAMPLSQLPAITQTAHYGTVYFTSAWIVLANVLIAELLAGKKYLEVSKYATVFLLFLALSFARYSSDPVGELRTVVAGQPGVDLAFGDEAQAEELVARSVDMISTYAIGADLLVLPEGIVKAGGSMPPPVKFKVNPKLPVVFGGQSGTTHIHQSAFSFDGHWEVADKTRLVVFGEYVPLRSTGIFDSFRIPGGDLEPGEEVRSLNVGKFRVGTSICFEEIFPNVAYQHAMNGSNILAVMSVDDWYIGSNAPEQLRDAAGWRAIETGMPVVRAASLGYSDIFDARGRIITEAPLGQRYALTATVRVGKGPDLFPLLPVFPYLSVFAFLALPAWDLILRRRDAKPKT